MSSGILQAILLRGPDLNDCSGNAGFNGISKDGLSKMNHDREIFIWRRLPARLNAEQVCLLLAITPAELSVLMRKRFVVPLGDPPSPNCTKYFASAAILELMSNQRAIDRLSRVLYRERQEKNRLQIDQKKRLDFSE